jgi:hypothetical protein
LFATLQHASASMAQARYAAEECSSRDAPPEEWQPSEACRHRALMRAATLQPLSETLTSREVEAVGRIGLRQDLLPIEEDTA